MHENIEPAIASSSGDADVTSLVARILAIDSREEQRNGFAFRGAMLPDASDHLEEVRQVLQARGLGLWLSVNGEGRAAVVVAPLKDAFATDRANPLWNLLLLAATLVTTTWAGAFHLGIDLRAEPGRWREGAPYALAILAILGIHELGHYFTARRRGIHVTLPYFIPAPVYLGTFGAFIRMRGVVRDRASYFDVAIMGPLAGLVVAVVALFVGLRSEVTAVHGGVVPASSALLAGLYTLAGGETLYAPVMLGPLAYAGYIGLVVTALNLAPIGQLDGGHVAYALLGRRRAEQLALAVIGAMVVAGLLYSGHWLMWAIIAWLIAGGAHPSALDEAAPIGRPRVILGGVSALLLLAIISPWPA